MSIGDTRRYDGVDLTTEHLERVARAKEKTRVQMTKIIDACDQLKRVAESRNTYMATPDQWQRILNDARKEIDDVEITVRRAEERQTRGKRRWEW